MRPNDIARPWLGERPLMVVVCGRADLGRLLMDDLVRVFSARTSAELAEIRATVPLDVAVIEEDPWPGDDALALARAIRMQGIGTVLLARSHDVAQQWLRERIAIELGAHDLEQQLFESVWFACCETEIVRRNVDEAPSRPPPRPRYVATAGRLEPSKSTMTYVFGDLDLGVSTPALIAPSIAPDMRAPAAMTTVEFQPSESVLRSLREEESRDASAGLRLVALVLFSATVLLALAVLGWWWIFVRPGS